LSIHEYEQHAIKTQRSGGAAPLILNFSITWKWVDMLKRKLVGPQCQSFQSWQMKYLLPLPRIKPAFLGHSVTIPIYCCSFYAVCYILVEY